MDKDNTLRGIVLMVVTMVLFAIQDAFTKQLGESYSPFMIVLIRYWFFAIVIVSWAAARAGGIRQAARTHFPKIQILRGLLLIFEIVIMIFSFVSLGLVETHAVFVCYPLVIAALSGPLLGEDVGWRRWAAIGVGFVGVMVVLRPGLGVFDPAALIPLCAAFIFGFYNVLTRYVAKKDKTVTSFFWLGVSGVFGISLVGPFFLTPLRQEDWIWMLGLCITAVASHFVLIKAYEAAEASKIQPFAFFQFPFVILIGITFFDEAPDLLTYVGASIIIGSGLFTFWRERQAKLRAAR